MSKMAFCLACSNEKHGVKTRVSLKHTCGKGNDPILEVNVPAGLNALACGIFERNVLKGFYEKEKNIGEMLCLIHSEVSEALEADRNSKYSRLPDPDKNVLLGWVNEDDFTADYNKKVKGSFEEEMADIFIRLLDMCAYQGVDIEFHVKAKMRYNLSRKKYHEKKY